MNRFDAFFWVDVVCVFAGRGVRGWCSSSRHILFGIDVVIFFLHRSQATFTHRFDRFRVLTTYILRVQDTVENQQPGSYRRRAST